MNIYIHFLIVYTSLLAPSHCFRIDSSYPRYGQDEGWGLNINHKGKSAIDTLSEMEGLLDFLRDGRNLSAEIKLFLLDFECEYETHV